MTDIGASVWTGRAVGPYVLGPVLGRGGMGEVYRARDTRLGRDVAIKILPAAMATHPERLARFDREARLLASLTHPHIATIHGVEDVDGTRAIVMELVEGPTLAERIAQGRIPLGEALTIVRQIADALEAAHERGIVHRDLKPANIKLGADGNVKVLDFGLAKAVDTAEPASRDATGGITHADPSLTTRTGVILGTAAYMSPEQARGNPVNRRTDLWALGCVLYELLTGTRAFPGATVAETISAVLLKEPDWTKLPRETPALVVRLLRRTLHKSERQRLADASTIRLELEGEPAPASPSSRSSSAFRWLAPIAALVVALVAATAYWLGAGRSAAPRFQFTLVPPGGASFASVAEGGAPAVSPDGHSIAYVAERAGARELWVQTLGAEDARPIAGTEGASGPFWSPGGDAIGFLDVLRGRLKKVMLAGGPALDLAEAQISAASTTAAWGGDGRILFYGRNNVLYTVPAAGGAPAVETERHYEAFDENHYLPSFLPDGRHYLLLVRGGAELDFSLYVGELGSRERRLLTSGVSNAQFAPSIGDSPGFVLFVRNHSLMAQPFDVERLAFTGDAVPVAERVAVSGFGSLGDFAVSSAGTLAYRQAFPGGAELVWLDRSGAKVGSFGDSPGSPMANLRISPNGRRVAFTRRGDSAHDVWVGELGSGRLLRLTFEGGRTPVWSPSGDQIAFVRGDTVFRKPADGTGVETAVWSGTGLLSVNDWSGDARHLLLTRWDASAGLDGRGVWLLQDPLATPASREPLFVERGLHPQFVPGDGPPRWISYDAGDIYLSSMPGTPPARLQLSNGGGNGSRWRRDGREVYFSSPRYGSLTAIAIGSLTGLAPGPPQTLFPLPRAIATAIGQYGLGYDIGSDGDRFLVTYPSADAPSPSMTVILNWQVGLGR